MFKVIIVLYWSSLLAFSSATGEDCDSLGVLFYEDIGCKPVKVEGKACPVEFRCDDFTIKNDTCLFQSKFLNSGETIDSSMTEQNCRVSCTCNAKQDQADTRNIFRCFTPDCPEWSPDAHPERGCYNTYIPGQCCSSGEKCEHDPDVAKCQGKNGRTHFEDTTMDSLDCSSCSDCFCQRGSAGKGEIVCKRSSCLVQLTDSDKLAEHCAPVNFSRRCPSLCCPDTFACPKDTDVFRQITNVKDSDLKCKFGTRTVKLGEGLDTTAYHHGTTSVTCECIMPPFLTCRKRIN